MAELTAADDDNVNEAALEGNYAQLKTQLTVAQGVDNDKKMQFLKSVLAGTQADDKNEAILQSKDNKIRVTYA